MANSPYYHLISILKIVEMDYFMHIYLSEISMNIIKQTKLISVSEIHNCGAFSFVLSFALTC